MALANDAPFWQPTDQGRVAIPQPRPQKFILDKDGIELQASMGEIEPSPPKVPDRKPYLTFYPCSQCHTYWETNPEPRKLAPVHPVGPQHG